MDVLILILMLICGAIIGAAIVLTYLNKSMDDMIEAYEELERSYQVVIQSYKNINYLNDKIIEMQQSAINNTYTLLVKYRDHNEGTLDEAIGILGEVLDDHREEADDNESDSD